MEHTKLEEVEKQTEEKKSYLIKSIIEALSLKRTESERKDIIYRISREIGYWDSAKRYYVDDEYITDSIKEIRRPSRVWNLSYFSHINSRRYLKQLLIKLEEK